MGKKPLRTAGFALGGSLGRRLYIDEIGKEFML